MHFFSSSFFWGGRFSFHKLKSKRVFQNQQHFSSKPRSLRRTEGKSSHANCNRRPPKETKHRMTLDREHSVQEWSAACSKKWVDGRNHLQAILAESKEKGKKTNLRVVDQHRLKAFRPFQLLQYSLTMPRFLENTLLQKTARKSEKQNAIGDYSKFVSSCPINLVR